MSYCAWSNKVTPIVIASASDLSSEALAKEEAIQFFVFPAKAGIFLDPRLRGESTVMLSGLLLPPGREMFQKKMRNILLNKTGLNKNNTLHNPKHAGKAYFLQFKLKD